MKKSRTGSRAREAVASPPVATVQVPLPLLDVLADAQTAFFGLCLTAGQQVFQTMMEHDREQLCGPKNVPDPDRHAYRGGSTPSEVVPGGRRIILPRLRARSVTGLDQSRFRPCLPEGIIAIHRSIPWRLPLSVRSILR